MIESLTGTLRETGGGRISLDVGGVGFLLRASISTLGSLPPAGAVVTLRTRLLMPSNDAPVLFGFATRDEAELFDRMRSIGGVGPGVALAILAIPVERVREALRARDVKLLTTAKGVGNRLARRLITELADTLPDPEAPLTADPERELLVSAFESLQFGDRRRIEAVADELMATMPDADLSSRVRVGITRLTGSGD